MTPGQLARKMADEGASADMIACAMEAIDSASAPKSKSVGALRQERYRNRKRNASRNSDVTSDVTDPPLLPPRDITQPLSSPPIQSSLRSDSSDGVAVDIATVAAKRQAKVAEEAVFQAVGDRWNAMARSVGLAEIQQIRGGRESALRARVREVADFGFAGPVEAFETIIAKVRGSPFLLGERGGWKADFDFIVSPKGFTKILEGAYEVQAKSKSYA